MWFYQLLLSDGSWCSSVCRITEILFDSLNRLIILWTVNKEKSLSQYYFKVFTHCNNKLICWQTGDHVVIFVLYLCAQDTPVGTSILMVNATDPDQGTGGSILFSFQPPSTFFNIDGARGIVTVIRRLDYETTTAYQLTVNATVITHIHSRQILGTNDLKMIFLAINACRSNTGQADDHNYTPSNRGILQTISGPVFVWHVW